MVTFWVTILALSILLYVLLDGFDLGVGMLFGLTGGDTERRTMMSAVAPVWDGNETWLVVSGVTLWGAFPLVYSILMSAFYLPVLLTLAGLILRGVAFEYRHQTERMRWIWDASFAGGSFVAEIATAFLLLVLLRQTPRLSVLLLANAYLYSALMALAYVLSFPGAIARDRPLAGVVDEVNRYRPGKIIITSGELKQRVVNGTFQLDRLDDFVAQVQQLFGARVTSLPGGVVLLS